MKYIFVLILLVFGCQVEEEAYVEFDRINVYLSRSFHNNIAIDMVKKGKKAYVRVIELKQNDIYMIKDMKDSNFKEIKLSKFNDFVSTLTSNKFKNIAINDEEDGLNILDGSVWSLNLMKNRYTISHTFYTPLHRTKDRNLNFMIETVKEILKTANYKIPQDEFY